jgi:hypothetical protein
VTAVAHPYSLINKVVKMLEEYGMVEHRAMMIHADANHDVPIHPLFIQNMKEN